MDCVAHEYLRKAVNGEQLWVCKNCHHVSPLKPLPNYDELLKENSDLKQRIAELEDKLRFFVELNYDLD